MVLNMSKLSIQDWIKTLDAKYIEFVHVKKFSNDINSYNKIIQSMQKPSNFENLNEFIEYCENIYKLLQQERIDEHIKLSKNLGIMLDEFYLLTDTPSQKLLAKYISYLKNWGITMSNKNINKLAKYIAHHVNKRGKFYGKFPVSDGYVFTAPEISVNDIFFHLDKNFHTQRIHIKLNKKVWYIERFEDTSIVTDSPTLKFTTFDFTITDAKRLIKDLPKNDVKAFTQAFKILYPKL